jgi:hypothetical protein
MPTYGFINPGVTGPNPMGAPIVVAGGATAVAGVAEQFQIHTVGGETGDHGEGIRLKLMPTNASDKPALCTPKTGTLVPGTPSQQVVKVSTFAGGETPTMFCAECIFGICVIHGRRLFETYTHRPGRGATGATGGPGATGATGAVDPEEGVPPDAPEP